jgi:prepilin peptidase CpaA
VELVQACAVSVAGLAAVTDVWSRRIPNWVTFGTLTLGVLLNAWLHGPAGVFTALAGAALGIGLLLPFWALGGIGAGDAKLLGAVGALLGPQALLSVAVYAALAGGVLSIAYVLRRGRGSGVTAPYGVAIATGVLLSLMLPSLFA